MSTLSFLPPFPVLLAYSAAAFLIAITPGPDMALFISRTLAGGARAGFATMLGAVTGLVVHALFAAFGLSAILATSATAFGAIKAMGALYLLWLAFQTIRHGSALKPDVTQKAAPGWRRNFLTGLGINLTNPKVVMFFVTFLPQFVAAGDPDASGKLLFLGLWFLVIGMPTASMIILTAQRFIETMQKSPRLLRGFDYGFAALMTAFAARLVFDR